MINVNTLKVGDKLRRTVDNPMSNVMAGDIFTVVDESGIGKNLRRDSDGFPYGTALEERWEMYNGKLAPGTLLRLNSQFNAGFSGMAGFREGELVEVVAENDPSEERMKVRHASGYVIHGWVMVGKGYEIAEEEEEMAKFEVGDKVRITDVSKIMLGSVHLENGFETEVMSMVSDDGSFRVRTPRGHSFMIDAARNEHHGIEKLGDTPKFEVGDKVRILDASAIWLAEENGIHTGDVVGVVSVNFEGLPRLFINRGEHGLVVGRDEFHGIEKYVAPVVAEFNAGDVVRVTNLENIAGGKNHFDEGDVTTIKGMEGSKRMCLVSVKNPQRGAFSGNQLYVVDGEINSVSHVTDAEIQQGKLADKLAELDAINERAKQLSREIAVMKASKPQGRYAVIQQARDDVANLTQRMYDGQGETEGNHTFRVFVTKPEFFVNRRKGVVTALARGAYTNDIREKGFANCSPDDEFIEEIGKAIALRRALGLEVPQAYLTLAPPPKASYGAFQF